MLMRWILLMPRKPKQTQQLEGYDLPPTSVAINAEGVTYVLDWEKFPVLGFVFIRCLNTDEVMRIVRLHASRWDIGVHMKTGIRNGYWGVGVWRTK